MWRGGCRLNISVAASFVWRCLSGPAMTPFPHPAHRTGRADFPHPALGQDFTPLLSRAMPSAVSEHSCGVDRSRNLHGPSSRIASVLNQGPFPPPAVTRLPRYYEPLRHPRAPGLSLTGFQLVIAGHASGLPVLRAISLYYMPSPVPRREPAGCDSRCITHPTSAFPERQSGRPAHISPYRGMLERSLSVPACMLAASTQSRSRYYRKLRPTSLPPSDSPIAYRRGSDRCRVGLAPNWKTPPWHGACKVEMWRGGCRLNISVAASFVWRCLSGSAMTPFPHPAHRTGRADFPHPALGQDFTPLLSRVTPSAVFEHLRS